MNSVILRPCKICQAATKNRNGYCDKHQDAAKEIENQKRLLYDQWRGTPSSRGYDRTWAKARKVYLLQHPLCEECLKENRITPAREVHHIVALRDGGDRLNQENFMAVCRDCHRRLTMEEIKRRNESI